MKKLIISFFVWSRLLSLWRYWHRKRITILSLHGVVGESGTHTWTPFWGRPSTEQLRSAIQQLSKYYTFISLDHAIRILDGSSAAVKHGLVLTFDDGYRNNFSAAFPLLKSMDVPASFFIATGYVESGKSYWVDRLDYALQHAPVDQRVLSYRGQEFDFRGDDRSALAKRYRDLRVSIKNHEREEQTMLSVIDALAGQLESASGRSIGDIIDRDPYVSISTWSEIRTAGEMGATIGSHSVDHSRLDAISHSAVDSQLVDSKREIETQLDGNCALFCYPNGSFDDYVLERVEQAGYRAAVTTVRGLNSVGDNLFALKRYPMPLGDNVQKNLLQISGIYESWAVKILRRAR